MITAKKISVLFDVPIAFLEDAEEMRFGLEAYSRHCGPQPPEVFREE
jgi:hypothetical protein